MTPWKYIQVFLSSNLNVSLPHHISSFLTFSGVAMTSVVIGRGGSSLQMDGSSWVESTTVTCTPTYGFLPCTTELWGELFLIVVYNYLTAVGSTYVSKGSDLFFKMFGTGILGASVFQILGTVPQMVIMLGESTLSLAICLKWSFIEFESVHLGPDSVN